MIYSDRELEKALAGSAADVQVFPQFQLVREQLELFAAEWDDDEGGDTKELARYAELIAREAERLHDYARALSAKLHQGYFS